MTADELKESIFMALGEASMCWDPLPSNQVFESTRAKEIGDKLVEKIMPILSQCEAMRSALVEIEKICDEPWGEMCARVWTIEDENYQAWHVRDIANETLLKLGNHK